MAEETPKTEEEKPVENKEEHSQEQEKPAEQATEQPSDEEGEVSEEEELKLPFPNAAIVRLMKRQMDGEKMIKKEVKLAMNKWLGNLCATVSKEMNKFPYVMMHLHEFQQATKQYTDMDNFQREKERILAHMDSIKKDIEKLERDLGKVEEDVF